MKKFLLSLLIFLPPSAFAQSPAELELNRAITNAGRWGDPRYTTTNRPTCNTSNLAAYIWNTTTSQTEYCDGSSWTAAGGGALTPGTTAVTGATSCLMRADASSLLQCTAWLTADDSGAGTPVITFTKTPSGASATSNFFNLTGTLPATLTAAANALNLQVTGAGSSTQVIRGLNIDLLAGFTGDAAADAIHVGNTTRTKGGLLGLDAMSGINVVVKPAAIGGIYGTTFGVGVAASGLNTSSDIALGYWSRVDSAVTQYGIATAVGLTGSSFWGGFFSIADSSHQSPYTFVTSGISGSAALAATNWSNALDIFRLYDNTTLKVAAVDGGQVALYNMSLTAGTMTVETNSQARTTTHSATWTNAQVVALGAALSGDITAFTLPAKTVVENAYVVITGQGAGTTTLTVSCGRTGAGYIDYIVASDAKAAANTVYGDAAAERGTNLTGYDLPSYTTTTAVVCQFVSTGANLDQVTGSTGRLILKTSLVP